FAWRVFYVTFEKWHKIVAVKMNVEGLAVELAGLHALLDDVSISRSGGEGGNQVFVCEKLVVDGAGLDDAGPTDEHGHSVAALPVSGFFAAVRSAAAIGPGHHFRTVVGGVDNDGVVGDAEFIELVQELADMPVVLNHPICFESVRCLAHRLRFKV